MKIKTAAARLFMIGLLAFGLWQVPTSVWLSLWDWALETGRLALLAK
jgi:hypothetical protein